MTLFKVVGKAFLHFIDGEISLRTTVIEAVGTPELQIGIARTPDGEMVICEGLVGRDDCHFLSNKCGGLVRFLSVDESGLFCKIYTDKTLDALPGSPLRDA